MHISGNTFALSGPRWSRTAPHQLTMYETQRPKMCARFGSAARLKAGSQPIGGRESVVTTAMLLRGGLGGDRQPVAFAA